MERGRLNIRMLIFLSVPFILARVSGFKENENQTLKIVDMQAIGTKLSTFFLTSQISLMAFGFLKTDTGRRRRRTPPGGHDSPFLTAMPTTVGTGNLMRQAKLRNETLVLVLPIPNHYFFKLSLENQFNDDGYLVQLYFLKQSFSEGGERHLWTALVKVGEKFFDVAYICPTSKENLTCSLCTCICLRIGNSCCTSTFTFKKLPKFFPFLRRLFKVASSSAGCCCDDLQEIDVEESFFKLISSGVTGRFFYLGFCSVC